MNVVRRLALVLAFIAAALASESSGQQTGKVHHIGLLSASSAAGLAPRVDALRQGLRDLGYVEGKNLTIEYRWADDKYDRLPALAAELVRLRVDVIVTHGTPGALAAKQATTTIPVVVALLGDPVVTGVVSSYARPGGNITGQSFHFPEMMPKRIEVLKDAVPRLSRVALLRNPGNQANASTVKVMEQIARSLKVEPQVIDVRGPAELDAAFSEMAKRRSEGLVVVDDSMLISHARAIAELAARKRIPAIGSREFVVGGGLLAYAANIPEAWRRSAAIIDKVLKGAKPADLPIEQWDRLELTINLRAAKALGLTLPQSLMVRADHIIQ